ncbi:MAG: argininosuccinate lyase [bacterium]|nr:argininosuccinate lyase [bacterium]
MVKLWQKNWQLDRFIESFETKDDLVLDQKLAIFDVYGSLAHIKMLAKIGILSSGELKEATKGLLKIIELIREDKFQLQPGDEDIHTKVENFITEHNGEVGKKIHTGRSRNDQVLTDIQLFAKEKLTEILNEIIETSESFHSFARKNEFVAMPGYTHSQKAMPSSVGMWASSFAESFMDDLDLVRGAFEVNDKCTLGSAAAYGVPLNLDRDCTARLLGFKSVLNNSLYCQNSRGKNQAAIIGALISVLSTINKFATDVLLFTSPEFDYFTVSEEICSGSSIMPQKKNVDIAELLRSKLPILLGYYVQMVGVSGNLMSGYNRDLQDTKKSLIESLEIALDSLKVAKILINNLKANKEKLKKSLTPEIFSTHFALDLVAEGKPFREAYKLAAGGIPRYPSNIEKVLKKSTHKGGTGNLCLAELGKKIKKEKKKASQISKLYKSAIRNLLKGF